MQKKYIILLILFFCVVLSFYIIKQKNNNNLNIKENRDIKVSTQSEISLNDNKIVVTIKNIGLDNVSFGLEYEIQILNNGRWEFFYKDETVDSIGIYLEKGESYDQIINLNKSINWEIDGTYRIIKKINENQYISNEFNLIP